MGKPSSPQWGAPIGFEFGINRVRLPLSSAKKPLQAQLEGAEVQREDAHSYSSLAIGLPCEVPEPGGR